MRGWGIMATGRGLPDPILPIGPKQDAGEIAQKRKEAADNPEAKWTVKDGELRFKSAATPNAYDPPSQIQYLRPLLDGESVEFSVWWEWDSSEVHPSIGRTVLQLGREGVVPSWISARYDLGQTGYVAADKLVPPPQPLAKDNVPIDKSWNVIKMTRGGDTVVVTLNGKPLVEIPVTEPPRPGIMRNDDRDVRVRAMKLTGDWPSQLPADLMQPTTK